MKQPMEESLMMPQAKEVLSAKYALPLVIKAIRQIESNNAILKQRLAMELLRETGLSVAAVGRILHLRDSEVTMKKIKNSKR